MSATLKCSFGSSQPSMMVINPTTTLGGKGMANIMDFKPMANILPFGMCKSIANPIVAAATAANYGKLQEMPCIPATVAPWIPGKANTLVNNLPALTDDCKCMCMWAGVIEITNDGQ
jgi:hypothetical protein